MKKEVERIMGKERQKPKAEGYGGRSGRRQRERKP